MATSSLSGLIISPGFTCNGIFVSGVKIDALHYVFVPAIAKTTMSNDWEELKCFCNRLFPHRRLFDFECHQVCTNGRDTYHQWNVRKNGWCAGCGRVYPNRSRINLVNLKKEDFLISVSGRPDIFYHIENGVLCSCCLAKQEVHLEIGGNITMREIHIEGCKYGE
mgnify:CR=1 FL=1